MDQFLTELISILGTLVAGAIAAVFRLFGVVSANRQEIEYIKKEVNKLEGGQESIRASVEDQRTRLAVIDTKLEALNSNTTEILKLLNNKP